MSIDHQIAEERLTCFRCSNLGLPPRGIRIGECYVHITATETQADACLDCFERLREEIDALTRMHEEEE